MAPTPRKPKTGIKMQPVVCIKPKKFDLGGFILFAAGGGRIQDTSIWLQGAIKEIERLRKRVEELGDCPDCRR